MEHMLLIDAYSQIYRCFYAVRSLKTKAGEPSNVIFSFIKFLLKLQDDFPTYSGAFVFDKGRPPHRLQLLPEYKMNRPPMPEDLLKQLDTIRVLISAFGWNSIQCENWEADDLIACIAKFFNNFKINIISSDKDISQIIDNRVSMLVPNSHGKGFVFRGCQEVEEKFGVKPKQIPDYLALIGDSSDNIPGVEGVGPKTAAQLIRQAGSIENMIRDPKLILNEKIRSKIQNAAQLLDKNLRLIRLVTECEVKKTWTIHEFQRNRPNCKLIREIVQHYELNSVTADIDKLEKQINDRSFDSIQDSDKNIRNNLNKKFSENQNEVMEQRSLF